MSITGHRYTLCIRTFGGFQFMRNGKLVPLSEWKLHKSLQLFKYLLVHRGQPVSIPQLLGVFWPDMTEQRGRRNLQATLYVLRRVLEPDLAAFKTSRYLIYEKGQYILSLDRTVWLDLNVFDSHIRRASQLKEHDPDTARQSLRAALKLYHDRFLPEDLYEDWTVYTRERYHDLFIQASLDYAELEAAAGNMSAAISACRKALAHDPYVEELHRALMRYYAIANRRADAVQQYRQCRRMLEEEFGVAPSRKTEALYREIVREDTGEENPSGSHHPSVTSPHGIERPASGPQSATSFNGQDYRHRSEISYGPTAIDPPLMAT